MYVYKFVECPYCGHEMEVRSRTFDCYCVNCDKEFEVEIEIEENKNED